MIDEKTPIGMKVDGDTIRPTQRTGILQVVEAIDSLTVQERRADIEAHLRRALQRQLSDALFAALDDGRPYEVTITPFARDESSLFHHSPFGRLEHYRISALIVLTDPSVAEVGEYVAELAMHELPRDPLRWERRQLGGRFFERRGRLWERVI